MRSGLYKKKSAKVQVGKFRTAAPAQAGMPAKSVRRHFSMDKQKALAIGAVLLLALGIIVGTGGQKEEKPQIAATVSLPESTEEDQPPEEGSSVTLNVCVGDALKQMELEEYILGVVAAEMPASYELEALKAQAVAARTYTLRKKLGGGCQKIEGAEICTDHTHCQAYCSEEQMKEKWAGDYEKYRAKIWQAVSETAGQVLVYDGQPISALYFSSSGGMTESSEHVFGGQVPYLQSVSSPGESDYEGAQKKKEFSYAEVAKLATAAYPDSQLSQETVKTSLAVLSRYESGQVEKLKLGNTAISGVQARKLFGLRSANFTVSFGEDGMAFETVGYGHGVGMSQSGANAMGKNQSSYQQILQHYYTGVSFGNVKDFL